MHEDLERDCARKRLPKSYYNLRKKLGFVSSIFAMRAGFRVLYMQPGILLTDPRYRVCTLSFIFFAGHREH